MSLKAEKKGGTRGVHQEGENSVAMTGVGCVKTLTKNQHDHFKQFVYIVWPPIPVFKADRIFS